MEILFLPPILFQVSKCHWEKNVFFTLNSTVLKTHVYYIINSFIQERPDREILVSSLSIDQTVSQGIRSHLRFQSPMCPSRSDSTRLTRQEVTAMASVSHCTCDNSGRVTLHVALTPRCVQVGVGIHSMTLSLSPLAERTPNESWPVSAGWKLFPSAAVKPVTSAVARSRNSQCSRQSDP